jgi:DNA-binding LacI/PurR family transcriptional regulator
MPPKGKVGLREIAEAAHVSMATASRVMNGNGRVDAEIQKVVLAEARKLGINPSQQYKSRTLAFLLSNRAMLHAFHSRILSGAEAQCAARGWDMVFLSYHYPPHTPWNELHLPRVIGRRDLIRGVVLAGTNSTNLLELLRHKGITFSVLGNNVMGERAEAEKSDVVYADDIQGGLDATQHLLRLGHRHVWFVGNDRLPWFERFLTGYRCAMSEAGLTPRESNVDSEDDAECGYLGTKSLLGRSEEVTAIVAGNDQIAGGVYKALRDRGLSVPQDIAVVGCDDTVGMWLYPALSTTREFPEQLGKNLVEAVLRRIEDPDQEPQLITVPTEFIRRDSCGRPSEPREEQAYEAMHGSPVP